MRGYAVALRFGGLSVPATAFVRRNGRDAVIVVQNWTDKPVDCSVSFTVEKKKSTQFNGGLSFAICPWGCWISKVVLTNK